MNLSGYHEYPDFSRPSAVVGASKEHVEAALIGAERIEKEGELEQARGMRGQRFDEAEAHVMALRVLLIERLRERLREARCTQVEAAKGLGITRPQVSALIKGARKDFSMDMLLTIAARAGLKPELHFAAEEKRSAA